MVFDKMAAICPNFKMIGAYRFRSHLKSRLFAIQPLFLFDHSKSKLVLNSDTQCIQLQPQILRSVTVENFKEPKTLNTFIGDATRLWNKAPNSITNAKSIGIAKKEIKSFCKNLPI